MPLQTRLGHLRFAAVVALAALAVSACLSPAPAPTPTPTAEPTRTPRPTFTVTPFPTLTPTQPAATPTPASTFTPTPALPPTATAIPTANPNIDRLTGLGVPDATLLQKRPLHVCIGNDTGERPQYGLNKADIVYEYLMERNFNTRFTAVYWGQAADRIGPMRSIRLANLELAPQYDALIACQGGSDGTLWNLVKDGRAAYYEFFAFNYDFMDMNWATGFFNIYGRHSNPAVGTLLTQTSTDLLRKWLADNKKEKTVKVPGFAFSAPGSATPTAIAATSIPIPYPSECCAVQWSYDAASQRYLRTMNGEPHSDGATKERISASNVIVVYATHDLSPIDEGYGAMGWRIRLQGEGKASVFRDGVAIASFWRRGALTDFMQVVDPYGKPVPLHPGNTWIEIVPDVSFVVDFK